MFTGSLSYIGDTIETEVDGFTITARLEHDPHMGAPWDEHDGHGPVRKQSTGDKQPGERFLHQTVRQVTLYDFAEACRIARRDGWGCSNGRQPGETARAYAARAAEEDFRRMKAWCNDEWTWCGVVLSVEKAGIVLDNHAASLWGIESDSGSYLVDVANELLSEALDAAKARLSLLCSA